MRMFIFSFTRSCGHWIGDDIQEFSQSSPSNRQTASHPHRSPPQLYVLTLTQTLHAHCTVNPDGRSARCAVTAGSRAGFSPNHRLQARAAHAAAAAFPVACSYLTLRPATSARQNLPGRGLTARPRLRRLPYVGASWWAAAASWRQLQCPGAGRSRGVWRRMSAAARSSPVVVAVRWALRHIHCLI
jgi:hypothetical protein